MKSRTTALTLLTAAALVTSVVLAAQPKVLRPTFETPARLSEWTLDGSGTWDIAGGNLVLTKAGVPAGPIRRPAALAILNSEPLGKVTLELEARSEEPVDLAVRDVNIVVGYQSPTRFYYVHLAAKTDAVHNGIFLVADADRKRLDTPTSEPQLKDKSWHRIRVERDPASGRIAVFVNGSAAPALEARDTTLQTGRIGMGSFDETGQFRNVVVTTDGK